MAEAKDRAEMGLKMNETLKFRHEWKHEISYLDMLSIRQSMMAVAHTDSHAVDGRYEIRSLYFDNLYDKALREKIDGVCRREKFRIRYYNGNTDVLHLEKKSKISGLCNKQSVNLTREQAQSIVDGRTEWMASSQEKLIMELYSKIKWQGMRPKTIVDYIREPFIYKPGNVRVTLDYNIRTGLRCVDFLDWDCITIPAGDSRIILEVKWDEYLPDIIKNAVQLKDRRAQAFSKYGICRIYG